VQQGTRNSSWGECQYNVLVVVYFFLRCRTALLHLRFFIQDRVRGGRAGGDDDKGMWELAPSSLRSDRSFVLNLWK
jgi:hypothetical protein